MLFISYNNYNYIVSVKLVQSKIKSSLYSSIGRYILVVGWYLVPNINKIKRKQFHTIVNCL